MPIMNRSFNQPDVAPVAVPASASYSELLAKLTSDKWLLVTEGPSGAQLKKAKKISYGAFLVGVVLLFFYWPAGLLILIAAALEQACFTKEPTHFLSRDNPAMPKEGRKASTATKLILLTAILILGAFIVMQLSKK